MGKVAVWLAAGLLATAANAGSGDWPSYGRDPGGTRFSPLTQITPDNVAQLRVAWTYHLKAAGQEGHVALGSEATPLAIGHVLYAPTLDGRVVALDGDSGAEIWSAALPDREIAADRGIQYWPGDRDAGPELLVPTRQGKMIALQLADGKPVRGFGRNGVLDLKTADVMNGYADSYYAITSPPAVYRDLFITGSRVQENPAKGASGIVRAFNARTGALAWSFRTIPGPGEAGHDSWEGDSWAGRSGVNVWSQITVDAKRGIAYLPVAAPAFDRYGGDRKGTNLFSDSLVAVEAATGRMLWHYQIVHHDIWDMDITAPPALIDVRRGGHVIPAVVALNKAAIMFILDRVTGKPLYDVTEVAAPPSTIPTEQASPTQPIPVKPPQLARNSFRQSDLARLTPELGDFCAGLFRSANAHESERYSPLTADAPIVHFPGSGGGVEWNGGAFDPRLGLYFVNTSDMGSLEQLEQHTDGSWGVVRGRDSFFRDLKSGMLCQAPPWGSLTAVNVNSGDIAWRVNLGVTDSLPENLRDTGRPSLGGPIVTAGGLVFIGGTDDSRFRAFDSRSGREVWTYKLDYSAHATPVTYAGRNGRQYVAVIATGGTFLRSPAGGDSLVVFALPHKDALRTAP